jgi:acetyl-CoA carboxylase carboxyl transferase subunit alpha
MSEVILDFEKPIVELESKLQEIKNLPHNPSMNMDNIIADLEKKIAELKKSTYANLNGWQRVQLARHPHRPYTLDYIYAICSQFVELHGDRTGGDDKAIVGGLGKIGNDKVMIIGHQKGRDTKSRQYRNFGMANPEGYRKALRLMKLAEKFNRPVVTFIDTPGAYPGLHAEEYGQAEAIARNLREMAVLRVPIICIVIGEGASGGALGIGVGDRVLMLENTWYSVISPESCSSILWRSWNYKEQAAEALRLTANDNKELGIVDGVIPEPAGGAHKDPTAMYKTVKSRITKELKALRELSTEDLIAQRIDKFCGMGVYQE